MNYQHLPALNRYTSPNQYEALKEITASKSLTALLMKGSMSKTVGSLIRSAWIQPENYPDESGVLREGWAVSDAGKHAMGVYELRLEEERKMQVRRDAVVKQRKFTEELLHTGAVLFYRAVMQQEKRQQECGRVANELISVVPPHEYRATLQRIYEAAKNQVLSEGEAA